MEEKREIRITGVPTQLRKELKTIARNIGTDLSDFLKPKLKEIADSYPQQMKVNRES